MYLQLLKHILKYKESSIKQKIDRPKNIIFSLFSRDVISNNDALKKEKAKQVNGDIVYSLCTSHLYPGE